MPAGNWWQSARARPIRWSVAARNAKRRPWTRALDCFLDEYAPERNQARSAFAADAPDLSQSGEALRPTGPGQASRRQRDAARRGAGSQTPADRNASSRTRVLDRSHGSSISSRRGNGERNTRTRRAVSSGRGRSRETVCWTPANWQRRRPLSTGSTTGTRRASPRSGLRR